MKNKNLLLLSLFIGSIILFFACKTESDQEDLLEIEYHQTSNSTDYRIYGLNIYTDEEYDIISEHLNLPNSQYASYSELYDFKVPNVSGTIRVDADKATLGKVLFYDKNLSIDGTTSCESCHKQKNAFADDKAFSKGINGVNTERNSFALGSFISLRLEYYGTGGSSFSASRLFWDERADDFQDQMTQTFNNPEEMGIDEAELEARVNSKDYYNILAKKAFHKEHIDHTDIKNALAEFMAAFHSSKSNFDIGLREMGHNTAFTDDFDWFNTSENLGKQLFDQHCGSCHLSSIIPAPTNTIIRSANNGLDAEYTDQGIGGITSTPADNGKFKVPSLRNVGVSGPYMHDGRFETLAEVVDFYNDGVQDHPNLHDDLRDKNNNDAPKKLNLTNYEKEALVDFLNTLTDGTFINDPKFADPFKS